MAGWFTINAEIRLLSQDDLIDEARLEGILRRKSG